MPFDRLRRLLARKKRSRSASRRRLEFDVLEDRLVPSGVLATGAGPNRVPRVRVFDAQTHVLKFDILAFERDFRGGVSVAIGDVNADGTPDIIAGAGRGGEPRVRVFDGETGGPLPGVLGDFNAFAPDFHGGVFVASGDVNGDGFADVITGAGPGGPPRVKVFSGADGSVLADFLAFEESFTGGVHVSAGDFHNRHRADIIAAAGPGGPPRVTIFDGATQAVMADYLAYAPTFRGGVHVGAGDINHDGTIDVITGTGRGASPRVKVFSGRTSQLLASFLAYSASSKGGVRVDAVDADNDTYEDILTSAGAGHAPSVRIFDGTTLKRLQNFRAFGSSFTSGLSIAGAVARGKGTNFELTAPITHEIPVLERLARYVPASASGAKRQFVPVGAQSIEANKNVYVVTHGWAPGYRAWVDSCTDGHVLKWWETAGFGDQSCPPPKPNPGPDSPWMFQRLTSGGIVISPHGGLSQAILDADPKAVVLAYSWLDDSATNALTVFNHSIPEQAYLSEALTNINGVRMAEAVRQALGANYTGKVHLLGHSHGSKVATLAALALQSTPGYKADQLTLFDSPEFFLPVIDVVGPDVINATNFLWYFLQFLDVSKDGQTGTFVDNYFSAFGISYATLPIDGQTPAMLSKVVDTQLFAFPDSLFLVTDPGDWHSYPPAWYGQAAAMPCDDPNDTNGGLSWSPLLGFNPSNLAAEWEQAWDRFTFSQQNQACLTNPTFPPILPPKVTTEAVTITGSTNGPPAPVTSITLDTGNPQDQTFKGTFGKDLGESGISFDYSFSGTGEGTLVIQVNDYLAYYIDSQYVPDGVTQHATINIGWPSLTQKITITMQPAGQAGSTAQVTLDNFRQFSVSDLPI